MTNIPKGANVHVPSMPLRVLMGYRPTPAVPVIESIALLLDAGERARSGRDVVHIPNQARHPSGAVAHLGRVNTLGILGYEDQAVQWDVILPAVEAEVSRILILATADGLEGGPVLGQVPGLYIQVQSLDGALVARYDMTDAGSEKVLLLGEFYRRDGGWKFRAVGQGYDSGVDGIIADYKRLSPGDGAGAAPAAGVPQFAPPPPYQGAPQQPYQNPAPQQPYQNPAVAPGPYYGQQPGRQPDQRYGTRSGLQYDPYAQPGMPQQSGATGRMRAPVPGHSYAPGHRIVDPVTPAPPPFQVPQPYHQPPVQTPVQPPAPVPSQAPYQDPYQPSYGTAGHPYQPPVHQPPVHQPPVYQPPAPAPAAYGSTPAAPAAPDDPFARFPAFAPQTVRGSGNGAPAFAGPFPPGPVLLELVFRDPHSDWPVAHQLNQRREPANLLVSGECDGELVARAPAVAPAGYPLAVQIMASAEWTVTALPLSSVRRFGPRLPAHGKGSDVLAYYGPEARLEIEFQGDPRDHESSMSLIAMGVDDIDMAEADFVDTDYLLTSAVGPFRQTVHLPGGARLVQVSAKGAWMLTAHPH
ncbi:TerD family protein [Streptomyces qinzhouensis]|nr:TerD family protein [Streptomyces qinzhouensis]